MQRMFLNAARLLAITCLAAASAGAQNALSVSGAPYRDGTRSGFSGEFVPATDLAVPASPLLQSGAKAERHQAVAVGLSWLIPGVGSFYAGNNGHGLRHLLLVAGSYAATAAIAKWSCDSESIGGCPGNVLLFVAVGVVAVGNWVSGMFTANSDAKAFNARAKITP